MSYYETTPAMLTILKVGGCADLAALAKDYGTVGITSGKQERPENLVNQYLMGL